MVVFVERAFERGERLVRRAEPQGRLRGREVDADDPVEPVLLLERLDVALDLGDLASERVLASFDRAGEPFDRGASVREDAPDDVLALGGEVALELPKQLGRQAPGLAVDLGSRRGVVGFTDLVTAEDEAVEGSPGDAFCDIRLRREAAGLAEALSDGAGADDDGRGEAAVGSKEPDTQSLRSRCCGFLGHVSANSLAEPARLAAASSHICSVAHRRRMATG